MGHPNKRHMMCALLGGIAVIAQPTCARAAPSDGSLAPRADIAGARPQPEYDPLGLRIGTLVASPELHVGTGYDSNLFGLDSDVKSDGYTIFTPSLRIGSDWGLHGVSLSAHSTLTRYFRYPIQNTNEYEIQGAGKLDFDSTKIAAGVSLSRSAERRGANGTPLSLGAPSLYRNISESFHVQQDLGAIGLGAAVSHQDNSYSDITLLSGATLNQSFRDSEEWEVNVHAAYSRSPDASIGVTGLYKHARAKTPPSHTNDTLSFGGTFALDAGMFRVETEGTYLRRNFSNPIFRDFGGFIYNGTLTWYPTTLLTVSLHGAGSLDNSGVPTVGTIIARSYRLNADYELLRNVVLNAQISRRQQSFPEVGGKAEAHAQSLSGEYKVNRTVAIGAYGRHECKSSSVRLTAKHYCVALAGLTLTFKH